MNQDELRTAFARTQGWRWYRFPERDGKSTFYEFLKPAQWIVSPRWNGCEVPDAPIHDCKIDMGSLPPLDHNAVIAALKGLTDIEAMEFGAEIRSLICTPALKMKIFGNSDVVKILTLPAEKLAEIFVKTKL